MTTFAPPQTPPASCVEQYVNPAFTTDSLDEQSSSASPSPSRSPRHYAFTPRRFTRVPRAWERKPSTPYAPRTEGQRIWKRVPLAETNGNVQISRSRNEETVKIVKKLRAGEPGDSENATYLSTKQEQLEEVRRRKVSASTTLLANDTVSKNIELINAASDLVSSCDTLDEASETLAANDEQNPRSILDSPMVDSSAELVDIAQALIRVDPDYASKQNNTIVPESPTSAPADPENLDIHSDTATEDLERETSAETGDSGLSGKQATFAIDITEQVVPTTEGQAETEKSGRRRSSIGALFTGTGLIQLSEPSNSNSSTATSQAHQVSSPNDDTAFLHDFLTRTRAQKAAKALTSPQKGPANMPRQEPEVALDTGLLSPPSSAPTNLQPDDADQDNSAAAATSPCRRSARTRLPRPQKVAPTVPSNIPVRRSNGTEFIFLQRTEAQEVALATRANTRRNKADAILPRFKLPYLNDSNINTSPQKSPKKRKSRKQVAWDEQLTKVQDSDEEDQAESKTEMQEVAAESQPKAKKMKNLGTVNGTPAPKRTMEEAGFETQIPGRKLRSRKKS